ncbi:MAG: hypothetical protein GEEBNDBF_00627 [bacterium]|nr:hypothetical protein [bacterium]
MGSHESALRVPLLEQPRSLAEVTSDIAGIIERPSTFGWWLAFLPAVSLLCLGIVAVSYQIATGIGTWGLNKTIGWAFDITNFVFWVGIGHAGTLISAILFLFRQRWRTSVARAAEAMTIFAVMCAGIFPLIHMGRPWRFFWMLPYPNERGSLWVNFRSPLMWDFFAISTYFLISLLFWYVGLIPDLATLRDRAKPGLRKNVLTFFSCGWDGSHRTWHRYEMVYMLLAGLATPLVLSVHTIVSLDFAAGIVPGWHTTIFPPYFVAGAILSGMAMVLLLMIVLRSVLNLRDYLTLRHFEPMTKVILAVSLMVGLAYGTEFFTALYSPSQYEQFIFMDRATGSLAWGYWIMVVCNVLVPQLFWFPAVRKNLGMIFAICVLINVGMWFERFVIIVSSLQHDFLPSSWSSYAPTLVEWATFAGSFGLFFTMFLLFIRFLPVISIGEVKGVLAYGRHHAGQEEVHHES